MDVRENLEQVRAAIAAAAVAADRKPDSVRLVAVSKTKPVEDIRLVINAGQRVFGENRVQEAQSKWPGLKAETPDLELHLIGPLQSNKTADAVALFDVIQTVDREKIAREIAREIEKQGKNPPVFMFRSTPGVGTAKGRNRTGSGGCIPSAMPRRTGTDDLRSDVHPAGG